jgi:hypothetical protein
MLMRKSERFGAMAVAILMVAVMSMPAFAASDVTVGQFIQRLAMSKNLNASDARVAAGSLADAGYRLPAGLNYAEALTEGHVADIAATVGLKVRTSKPEADFAQANVDRFFKSFQKELRKPGTPGEAGSIVAKTDTDRHPGHGWAKGQGKGKGKGKGKNPHGTPTDPE